MILAEPAAGVYNEPLQFDRTPITGNNDLDDSLLPGHTLTPSKERRAPEGPSSKSVFEAVMAPLKLVKKLGDQLVFSAHGTKANPAAMEAMQASIPQLNLDDDADDDDNAANKTEEAERKQRQSRSVVRRNPSRRSNSLVCPTSNPGSSNGVPARPSLKRQLSVDELIKSLEEQQQKNLEVMRSTKSSSKHKMEKAKQGRCRRSGHKEGSMDKKDRGKRSRKHKKREKDMDKDGKKERKHGQRSRSRGASVARGSQSSSATPKQAERARSSSRARGSTTITRRLCSSRRMTNSSSNTPSDIVNGSPPSKAASTTTLSTAVYQQQEEPQQEPMTMLSPKTPSLTRSSLLIMSHVETSNSPLCLRAHNPSGSTGMTSRESASWSEEPEDQSIAPDDINVLEEADDIDDSANEQPPTPLFSHDAAALARAPAIEVLCTMNSSAHAEDAKEVEEESEASSSRLRSKRRQEHDQAAVSALRGSLGSSACSYGHQSHHDHKHHKKQHPRHTTSSSKKGSHSHRNTNSHRGCSSSGRCKSESSPRVHKPPSQSAPAKEEDLWSCECGAENQDRYNFCSTCGVPKTAAKPVSHWECKCCGRSGNAARYKFCVGCGTKR